LFANEEIAKNAVKELGKLKEVYALVFVIEYASEEIAKEVVKELKAVIQEFVKEKNVGALENMGHFTNKEVAEAARNGLIKIEELEKNKTVIDEIKELIDR